MILRRLARVIELKAPPNSVPSRSRTSTMASTSLSRHTRSSSPALQRRLRARTFRPRIRRYSAANASPAAPRCRCVAFMPHGAVLRMIFQPRYPADSSNYFSAISGVPDVSFLLLPIGDALVAAACLARGPGPVNLHAANPGPQHLRVANGGWRDRQHILAEEHHVGEFSGLERAFIVFLKFRIRRAHGVGRNRLLDR